MKSFFDKLFGGRPKLQAPPPIPKPPPPIPRVQRPRPAEIYKEGDVIGGKYEIHGRLGEGGFGIVYLAINRDTQEACALKTFRDELLADAAAREAFKKEALLWVNLEEHPFIVTAQWVTEVFGRLFVQMEYVAADDQGRVTLADHLARAKEPLNTEQVLRWAIQFCLGMEHAKAHGIECHRDIKPGNILIGGDGKMKISDFGLAIAAETAWREMSDVAKSSITGLRKEGLGFSLIEADGMLRCGTPGYMPPEIYRCEGADVRSDIYSFGLVLWQMASGNRMPPFMVPWQGNMESFLRGIYEQQITARAPHLDGPFMVSIEKCLRPKPTERYAGFTELRRALNGLHQIIMGANFEIPQEREKTAAFWMRKGSSLDALGRREEAINCFDQSLAIDPRNGKAWTNKGGSLVALNRLQEAVNCFDQALAIDPRNGMLWSNKGVALDGLSRRAEAIRCYDHALAIDPRDFSAWYNKGNTLDALGRREEAINCFDQALAIDPRYALAWTNKGGSLAALGRQEEAINCYDQALAIDPRDFSAWSNKGCTLDNLGRREEANICYDKALAIDPRCAPAWSNKGYALDDLGRREEAINCYGQALAIDPRNGHVWSKKGHALAALGRYEDAINCYDQALVIDPRDARAWNNKARSEDALEKRREAALSYRKFIELAPPQYAEFSAQARQRLLELESEVRRDAPQDTAAAFNDGNALAGLGRHEEAIRYFDKALAIDARDTAACYNKGNSLTALGRREEAIICYDQALAIDPRYTAAWNNKGLSLAALGRREEAVICYDQALAIDPRDAAAWGNKGNVLNALGRHKDALICYDRRLAIDPQDTEAWSNKGPRSITLAGMRRRSTASTKRWRLTRETRRLGTTRRARRTLWKKDVKRR